MAQKLGEIWGQTVLVENRPGANGSKSAPARCHQRKTRQDPVRSAYLRRSRLARFRRGNWWGMFVPVATPKPLVDRLHADLVKAMTSADLREKFDGMGVEALASTPDALRDFTRTEIERWGKLVREAGIRAD